MAIQKVYLGGPINGCTDEEASGWRDAVAAELEAAGIEVVDPMVRDYRGREMEPGIAEEIVLTDKDDIDSVDTVLINSPKPSYGTAMEMLYAWQNGKLVITVLPEEGNPSPWVVFHSDIVCRGSVLEAVRKHILKA